MLDILDIESFSLLAYSNTDIIESWRKDVIDKEKIKEQKYKENKYTEVTYTQSTNGSYGYDKAGSYNQSGYDKAGYYDKLGNVYTNTGYNKASYYDKLGNVYTNTGYSKAASYSKSGSYSQGTGYSQSGYSRSYSQGYSQHSYSKRYAYDGQNGGGVYTNRSPYGRHSNSHSNSYSKGTGYSKTDVYNPYTDTHTNKYGNGTGYHPHVNNHSDSYANGTGTHPHVNTHVNSTSPHVNTIGYYHTNTTAYSKGFNHLNYIPSAPELFNIDGNIFEGEITFNLASYDKNSDGFGARDQDSITILYDLKVRRTQDLTGQKLNEPWKVLLTSSSLDEFKLKLSGYEDGVYEVEAIAKNKSKTFNNVTEHYVSEAKTAYFTISQSLADITILNGVEFGNYSYGVDQTVSPGETIKKYVDGLIYANGQKEEQKGLFAEIDLKDLKDQGYHKVKASLEKDGKIITKEYDVVFELDSDGISPKKGNKKGVVFIPVEDMLDDGIYKDASIVLDIAEYEDKEFTEQVGMIQKKKGVNKLSEVLYVNLDKEFPYINMTQPDVGYVTSKLINISFADVGLGIMKSYYQVVQHGEPPKEENWMETRQAAATKILNLEGTWDVYAKTIDKAGNEAKMDEPYVYKISPVIADLIVPPVGYIGKNITVSSNIQTKTPITQVEFWIKNYTEPKEGKLTSKIDSTSNYITDITIPKNIPKGTHVVFEKIYLSDGTTKILSKNIEIKDVEPIDISKIEVLHTAKWDANRQKYNALVPASRFRTQGTFWSGEKLIPTITGTGIKNGRAYIKDTSYECQLDPMENNKWSGVLWNENMIFQYGQFSKENLIVIIELTDLDGKTITKEVPIIMDDIVKYYQLHRKL